MKKQLSIGKILVAVLLMLSASLCAFMGVMAIKKSMSLKLAGNFTPTIFCEIEMLKTGESNFRKIFSNVPEQEYVASFLSLDVNTSTLTLSEQMNGGIGMGFHLKIHNYTNTKLFVEASGVGVGTNAIAIDTYSQGATAPYDSMSIVSVTGDVNLTLTQVKEVFPTYIGTEFDLELVNNTIMKKNNRYFTPIGENLETKLALKNYYSSLPQNIVVSIGENNYNITSATSAVNGITYNATTGVISIANASITGDIEITATAIPQNFALNIPNFYENIIIEGDFETNTSNWGEKGNSRGNTEQTNLIAKEGDYSCKMTPTGDTQEMYIYFSMKSAITGHKYYNSVWEYNLNNNPTHDGVDIFAPLAYEPDVVFGFYKRYTRNIVVNDWSRHTAFAIMSTFIGVNGRFDYNNGIRNKTPYSTVPIWVDNLCMIDLTAKYGAGNEPNEAWCNSNIDDWSLNTQIPYGTNYTANIVEVTPDADRTESGVPVRAKPASINVTIGGQTATNGLQYSYNSTTGNFTIFGEYITGAISISS